jgi:hypothetical protein
LISRVHAFAEPAVALPSGPALNKANAVDVDAVRERVGALVCTGTAVRRRREAAGCGELVRAVFIKAWVACCECPHGVNDGLFC